MLFKKKKSVSERFGGTKEPRAFGSTDFEDDIRVINTKDIDSSIKTSQEGGDFIDRYVVKYIKASQIENSRFPLENDDPITKEIDVSTFYTNRDGSQSSKYSMGFQFGSNENMPQTPGGYQSQSFMANYARSHNENITLFEIIRNSYTLLDDINSYGLDQVYLDILSADIVNWVERTNRIPFNSLSANVLDDIAVLFNMMSSYVNNINNMSDLEFLQLRSTNMSMRSQIKHLKFKAELLASTYGWIISNKTNSNHSV